MSDENTSISFTPHELAGTFYLAAMGLASLMRNSSDPVEKKDAEIMYLTSAMGIKDLKSEEFGATLKKLDEIRSAVIGDDGEE